MPNEHIANDFPPEKHKGKRKRDGENPGEHTSKKDKKKKRKKNTDESTPTAPVSSLSTLPTHTEIESFLKKHAITIHAPDDSVKVTPIISFGQLDIPTKLRSAFTEFKEPTPVQACTWPPALQGRDVIGIAETGRHDFYNFGGYNVYLSQQWQNSRIRHPSHRPSHLFLTL
jgi:ATP-dependent RNA helicase DBP3